MKETVPKIVSVPLVSLFQFQSLAEIIRQTRNTVGVYSGRKMLRFYVMKEAFPIGGFGLPAPTETNGYYIFPAQLTDQYFLCCLKPNSEIIVTRF